MEGDLIAVVIGEGECPTEGAVDRCAHDGVTVGDESIVNGLDVGRMEPDRGTDAAAWRARAVRTSDGVGRPSELPGTFAPR